MKNRDKILDYFDNVADGTIVSANDMYEHGFERMNQEAFFRAVERLSDEGEIIRVGRGMYIKKSDAQGDIISLERIIQAECLPEYTCITNIHLRMLSLII